MTDIHDHTFDTAALDAAVNLIGRTAAKAFEIGYLHDNVPVHLAGWYAHAQYQGARIAAENHPGPVEAAEALARRLLAGGQCTNCKSTITLAEQCDDDRTMCQWTRRGRRWERGCDTTPPSSVSGAR